MADRKNSGRALIETIQFASGQPDQSLATLLIGVMGGLETAIEGVAWNTSTTCESALILARVPDSACSQFLLHCFTGSESWLKRFLELGEQLTEMVMRKPPEEQQALVGAWILMGRRIAEAGADSEAGRARVGMLRTLQQGVSDYMLRSGARVLDPTRYSTITAELSGLLSAIDSLERQPAADRGLRPSGGDGSWSQRLLAPSGVELDPLVEPTLQPNRVRAGERYDNANEYLQVHFELLREDFCRPLRESIGKVHAVREAAQRDQMPWQDLVDQLPKEVWSG